MATDYGYGIRSDHGKLTFNGVDYRQLDYQALNAMRRYLQNIPAPSSSHKFLNIGGHNGSKRDNWLEEQRKINRQIMAVQPQTDPMTVHKSWDRLLGSGGVASARGMSPEQMRVRNANLAGQVLQSIAPQYQALQSAPQEGQPGVATGGAMASASRAYANLIARQRNLSQLGV